MIVTWSHYEAFHPIKYFRSIFCPIVPSICFCRAGIKPTSRGGIGLFVPTPFRQNLLEPNQNYVYAHTNINSSANSACICERECLLGQVSRYQIWRNVRETFYTYPVRIRHPDGCIASERIGILVWFSAFSPSPSFQIPPEASAKNAVRCDDMKCMNAACDLMNVC